MIEYKLIEKYSMKCRLYPTKKQAQQIDNMLYGKACAYNMMLHNLKSGLFAVEKKSKDTGEIVHFPDFTKAACKETLDEIRHTNEFVNYLPGNALSGKSGVIADIKKGWEKTGKHPIEQWDYVKVLPDGRKQHFGPQYHSKKENNISFAYQTVKNNIKTTDNKKVIKVRIASNNYCVDGFVKIHGWNQSLRFDSGYQMDFINYLSSDLVKNFTIRISREHDRYYIIFTLKNVYRPYKISDVRNDHVGIDVGEKTLAVLSDETSYPNIFEVYPQYQDISDSIDYLNVMMSRRYGYKNEQFRKDRKINSEIKPSNNYLRAVNRQHKLYSMKNDIQTTYYNIVTADIVKNNKKVSTETLNVSDLFWYKEKQNEEKQKRKDEKANCNSQQKLIGHCNE